MYQVVPRHLILERIVHLILPKSEPGQLQKKLNHCLKNQKGYYLRNGNMEGNAHAAIHLRTINQFQKLVYLRKYKIIHKLASSHQY